MDWGIHDKHRVSTKLALYSSDLSSVLIMHYPIKKLNGLPGGHVDKGESPDEAMRRELLEELSLELDTLKRVDFFLDRRIILAYTAIAPPNVSITPTDPKFEYGEWVTKEQLVPMQISAEYKRFILENWPN